MRHTSFLSALTAAALIAAPGTSLIAAPTAAHAGRDSVKPARTVSAWLPHWDQDTGYRDALAHASQLHTVSPFWYELKADDRVDRHDGAERKDIVDGLHRAGLKVVPTVNEALPAGRLAALVTSPARRATHLRTLLAVAARGDYDGLELDYESIAPTGEATYRQVRAGYAALVTDLCTALHRRSQTCAVAVSPQADGSGRIWDYPALGRAADRVRIMGYDLHWRGGGAGPLSTPDWYDRTLAHATRLIPPAKIEMALPGYGWDWAPGTPTRHVTWKEAEALRKRKGRPYAFDKKAGSPHFTYREGRTTRTVWYQDARGVAAHLPALRKHGVTGTGLWALGFEDPAMWDVLARG
ncbi:glycosyl hydrolase family 18 protein [Streptomyces sp. NPDC051561]|uniref:glycosyl hydrolase family 18 protein n=1 Tax=Streptomyces sp. NPDC051561 TaxID=3365658 RepID=UPI003797B47A